MKTLKIIGLLTLLLFGVTCLNAQVIVINSEKEAIELALKQNANREILHLEWKAARVDQKSEENHWLPNVIGSFNGKRNNELPVTPVPGEIFGQPGQTINAQFGQKYNYDTGIMLQKDLFDWQSKQKAKLKKSQADIVRSELNNFEQDLSEQVIFYYYSTQIAVKSLELYESDLQIADSLYLLTKNKFEQGLIDQFQLNQAKMNQLQVQKAVFNGKSIYADYLNNLKILLGLTVDAELQLPKDLATDENSFSLPNAIGIDPEIESFKNQVTRAKINLDLQKAAFIPKFNFNYYWGKQQFRDDFGMGFSGNDWSDIQYASLGITINFFNKGQKFNNVTKAKHELKKAKVQYLTEQENSKLIDQLLLDQFQNSLSDLKLSQQNSEIAKQNLSLALRKYEQGVISLDQYLSYSDDHLSAQNAYLNSLTSVYKYYSIFTSRPA